MNLSTREYQMVRTKRYLKNNAICFFFQTSAEKAFDWLMTEQKVVSLGLKYYKVNTLAAQKVLSQSIHQLKGRLVAITTSLLRQKDKLAHLNRLIVDNITQMFPCLAIKINNIIYSTDQFKNVHIYCYQIAKVSVYNSLTASVKTKNLLRYYRNSVI